MRFKQLPVCALFVTALLRSNSAHAQQLDNIRVARSPEDFVHSRFVQEVDQSGLFAELNKAP